MLIFIFLLQNVRPTREQNFILRKLPYFINTLILLLLYMRLVPLLLCNILVKTNVLLMNLSTSNLNANL